MIFFTEGKGDEMHGERAGDGVHGGTGDDGAEQ